MSNIFENAYFGKQYKTRDDRKAIYSYCIKGKPNEHFLIVDKNPSLLGGYGDDGISNACGYNNPNLDIVSECEETINEEELEELAFKSASPSLQMGIHSLKLYKDGYKAGYRKAKHMK